MTDTASLVESLPVLQRLALSYAPSVSRMPILALLALDARLADIIRSASEPMLAQLRLAWWREQLQARRDDWPEGEPLLAVLKSWDDGHSALGSLADGWEAMTAEAPLPRSAMEDLAAGRASAFAGLAKQLGTGDERATVRRLGFNWALTDIASRLSQVEEKQAALDLVQNQDWSPARLSRKMRPLVVLHGLAARAVKKGQSLDRLSPATLFPAMRIGLLGI